MKFTTKPFPAEENGRCNICGELADKITTSDEPRTFTLFCKDHSHEEFWKQMDEEFAKLEYDVLMGTFKKKKDEDKGAK